MCARGLQSELTLPSSASRWRKSPLATRAGEPHPVVRGSYVVHRGDDKVLDCKKSGRRRRPEDQAEVLQCGSSGRKMLRFEKPSCPRDVDPGPGARRRAAAVATGPAEDQTIAVRCRFRACQPTSRLHPDASRQIFTVSGPSSCATAPGSRRAARARSSSRIC